MNRRPAVSVIVPTLNRPADLREALRSITCQQALDLAEVEVVVVNDGGAPIESVLSAARDQGLPVTAATHTQRRGLPSARNTGLEHARGETIAFLDDDDVFLPEHLSTALGALDSSAGLDGVATSCLVTDHRVDPTTPVTDAVVWDVAFDPLLLQACNLFPVHAAVFRRPGSARLDPGLPAIEDWDFWLRLMHAYRYRFARLSAPTVVYHRLAQADSMISAVADGTRSMAEFSGLVRRLWSRWPATTAHARRFRLYSGLMYWHVLGRLATGQVLNPHYYLHCLQELAHAWNRPDDEAALVERISQAVEGHATDDQHAAA